MGSALRDLCERESNIKVQDFKSKDINLSKVSLVIDFSSPEGFEYALKLCIQKRIPFISGTTGLTNHHSKLINSAKDIIPILIASNMSLGIANLKNSISKYILNNSSISKCKIVEVHHKNKKDSPSGTALEILKFLRECLNNKKDIPIEMQSHRIGNIYGIHRVEIQSQDGTIYFQHIANSRDIFAEGALMASIWAASRDAGLYSFADFLNKKL